MLDEVIIGAVALIALVAAAVIAKEKVADAAGNFADNPRVDVLPLPPRDEIIKTTGEIIAGVAEPPPKQSMGRIEAFRCIDSLSDFFGEEGNTDGVLAMRSAGLAMFARTSEGEPSGE